MRNAECGVRNVTVSVARRTTSHFNSAFRIPHSALVHTDATRLSRREDGEVTHAVTHTPHPTHPSGLRIGWPPASRASARSPTGQARAHTPHGTPWNVMQRSGSSSRIPRCTPAQPSAGGTSAPVSQAWAHGMSAHATHAWMPGSIMGVPARSEEHTSELQSRGHLVCRLLLEKK